MEDALRKLRISRVNAFVGLSSCGEHRMVISVSSHLNLSDFYKKLETRILPFNRDPLTPLKFLSLRSDGKNGNALRFSTELLSLRGSTRGVCEANVQKFAENFVVEDLGRGDDHEQEENTNDLGQVIRRAQFSGYLKKRRKEPPNDILHNLAKAVAVRVASEKLNSDEDVMKIVNETGLRVDVRSMNVVVWQLGQMQNWYAATKVFRAFRSAGVEPNAYVCTTLIAALGCGRRLSQALKLFRWMEKAGIERPIFTFNALMVACGRVRWLVLFC